MTSTELRRIVGAMTERPWKRGSWQYDAGPPFSYVEIRPSGNEDVSITADGPVPNNSLEGVKNIIGGCGCCGSPYGRAQDGDALVTLANHAKALVALVGSVERYRAASPLVRDVQQIYDALAAVHAVKIP